MKKRHGIVCAAYVLLMEQNQVLLLRRFNTGYEDGSYSVPAGHVEHGEAILDTLLREVWEEIGVKINKKNVHLVHVMHRKATSKNDERLDFFFVSHTWSGEVKNMEPHKCDDLQWFEVETLPKNVIPYVAEGIKNVMRNQSYSELGW